MLIASERLWRFDRTRGPHYRTERGMYSLIGPYYVAGDIGDGTKFRCTVKVTAKNNLVYSVDPEIIVDGPGPDPGPSSNV